MSPSSRSAFAPLDQRGIGREAPDQAMRLRVAIIEDDPPIRALIRVVLDASDVATLVAEADGTPRSVRAVCRQEPQVVLLDQHLGPRRRGTEMIGDVLRSCPSAMIAVFTGLDPETEEGPALRARAFAFYEKRTVTSVLPTILAEDHALFRRALAGEDVCAPTAADRRRMRSSSEVGRPAP